MSNQSTNQSHAVDPVNQSKVPYSIQKNVPEGLERALPDSIHNTDPNKNMDHRNAGAGDFHTGSATATGGAFGNQHGTGGHGGHGLTGTGATGGGHGLHGGGAGLGSGTGIGSGTGAGAGTGLGSGAGFGTGGGIGSGVGIGSGPGAGIGSEAHHGHGHGHGHEHGHGHHEHGHHTGATGTAGHNTQVPTDPSNPKSIGVSHATGPSKVPEAIQKLAPKGLEKALPESIHPTEQRPL